MTTTTTTTIFLGGDSIKINLVVSVIKVGQLSPSTRANVAWINGRQYTDYKNGLCVEFVDTFPQFFKISAILDFVAWIIYFSMFDKLDLKYAVIWQK